MKRLITVILLMIISLTMSACATRAVVGYGDGPHYKEGPPPHAPAHGYRHKHQHHDLVYDSDLGAYIVLGYDDHFFIDELYYRFRDGRWQVSVRLDDGWGDIDSKQVPYKLRHSKGKEEKAHKEKEYKEKKKKRDD